MTLIFSPSKEIVVGLLSKHMVLDTCIDVSLMQQTVGGGRELYFGHVHCPKSNKVKNNCMSLLFWHSKLPSSPSAWRVPGAGFVPGSAQRRLTRLQR
jgi:hypothetical protein